MVRTEEVHAMMEKIFGTEFYVASRAVPVVLILCRDGAPPLEGAEEAAPADKSDAKTVVICGPLEAKGIIGVDDRNYVLDVTRATPRDALQRRGDAYEGQLSKGQGQRVECDAVRLATPRRGAGAVVDRGLRHGRPPRTPRFSLLPCSFFAHPWQSLSPSPPPSPASPLILRSPIPERRR